MTSNASIILLNGFSVNQNPEGFIVKYDDCYSVVVKAVLYIAGDTGFGRYHLTLANGEVRTSDVVEIVSRTDPLL